jgi:hypothetical protein
MAVTDASWLRLHWPFSRTLIFIHRFLLEFHTMDEFDRSKK